MDEGQSASEHREFHYLTAFLKWREIQRKQCLLNFVSYFQSFDIGQIK